MKKVYIPIVVLMGLIIAMPAYAVPAGNYPGLQELIDTADAIVILRIDRNLSDFGGSPIFYSTHECYIYQTIKGNIAKNTRITLQLYDTVTALVTPYAQFSTHLMFLMKKARQDEPTEYRTLTFKGAQILLPPLGHEKAPEGKTIEQKIKKLIKDAIAYREKESQKNLKFLATMLGNQGMAETKEKKDRLRWIKKCIADFKKVKLGMTREEVGKLLPWDGGFQGFVAVRFCHPECRFFKVDVEFSVKRNPSDQDRVINSPKDKVVAVSKPYIEYPIMD